MLECFERSTLFFTILYDIYKHVFCKNCLIKCISIWRTN